MASQAVENDLGTTNSKHVVTLLKSHLSQTFGQCYYEVRTTTVGAGVNGSNLIETDVRQIPDDDWIAQCTQGYKYAPAPGLYCTRHNGGVINEAQFREIEDNYLSN
jgi:hypothetical protein